MSQALLSEAESPFPSFNVQSSLPGQLLAGDCVAPQATPRADLVNTLVAVRVSPTPDQYVNETGGDFTESQQPLDTVPDSAVHRMSAGESGPGDTQPISQSIFENIISREKSFMPSHSGGYAIPDAHNAAQESLQMTVKEGDSGHIDLLAGFGSNRPIVTTSSSDDEGLSLKEGHSSPAQFPTHSVFPESQRFLETPTTSEKQRDVPNVANTTPSLPRNPLAADLSSSGGILSMSQIFKATQAPSSPFVNGLPSAPLSDRPSPDFPIQARPLGAYASSPSRTPRPILTRTHTDPFAYVSMNESQKRREQMREERRTRSAENIDSEEPIDKDFDEESSFVQRLNRQREIEHETSARLASVTHGRSSSDPSSKPPADSIEAPLQDNNHSPMIDTQVPPSSFNNEATSEEETEKEDNVEVLTNQDRRVFPSYEEDKENLIEHFIDAAHATTAAHGRLSQALELQNDSTLTDTPPTELHLPTSEKRDIENGQQVINVRDSQPSPSQRISRHARTGGLVSQPDTEHISSSFDDSSSPRKKQRRQYEAEQKSQLSPTKQLAQRRSQSNFLAGPANRSPHHQASSNEQQSSIANLLDKPSSMPSLVANTPVNKVGDDNVPETSIPESSPNRIHQANLTADALSRLPPMQETEQEDDDLPTQHHQRQWDGNTHVQALDDSKLRKFKIFNSSSPEKGPIRSMTEISSQPSPQATPGDEIDFDFFNNEDREFSRTIGSSNSHVPRKRLRTTKDFADAHLGSSPLRMAEISGGVETEIFAHTEPQSTEPGSPGSPLVPAVARRQRGRSSRPREDMFEMDGSPRARKSAVTPRASRLSEYITLDERKSPGPSGLRAPSPLSRSSQHSFVADAKPIQTNQIERDKSIVSIGELSNNIIQSDNLVSDICSPAPEDSIVAPKQVLALWNGRKRAYYPATYLGPSGPQRCMVAFVDSGPVEVAVGSVKRLDLRVGDAIKVDYKGVPKVTHIVRGFSQRIKSENLAKTDEYLYPPVTDIYGFSSVILTAKQRKSIPGGGHIESEQTVEVPIHSIYLDMILWNQLKGRAFTINENPELLSTVAPTPTRGASTPVSPGSKLSRTHLTIRVGLFSGMVFAVSFGDQDAHKIRVTKLITENGGQVLQGGFEELFDYPANVPAVKQAETLSQSAGAEEDIHFRLASGSENIGFACLIADKHSRRAKYMQALALNLPCLSGRWIEDCVSQNRIISWEQYLLPAGESRYLYGAIKSRVLKPVSAEKVMFAQMIDERAKLLDGQSVLLVLGRGKTEERRKAYLFLAYALGAVKVGRVLDLKAGNAVLRGHVRKDGEQHKWDWLYVDDHEEVAAKEMTIGKSYDNGNRKRKRPDMSMEFLGDQSARSENPTRVMSNEFVCQSLILGKMC